MPASVTRTRCSVVRVTGFLQASLVARGGGRAAATPHSGLWTSGLRAHPDASQPPPGSRSARCTGLLLQRSTCTPPSCSSGPRPGAARPGDRAGGGPAASVRARIHGAITAYERQPQFYRAQVTLRTSTDTNARAVLTEFDEIAQAVLAADLAPLVPDGAQDAATMLWALVTSRLTDAFYAGGNPADVHRPTGSSTCSPATRARRSEPTRSAAPGPRRRGRASPGPACRAARARPARSWS